MRAKATSLFTQLLSSDTDRLLLLSCCCTSTETVWFIRDRGNNGIGNESPGPPPCPDSSWALYDKSDHVVVKSDWLCRSDPRVPFLYDSSTLSNLLVCMLFWPWSACCCKSCLRLKCLRRGNRLAGTETMILGVGGRGKLSLYRKPRDWYHQNDSALRRAAVWTFFSVSIVDWGKATRQRP